MNSFPVPLLAIAFVSRRISRLDLAVSCPLPAAARDDGRPATSCALLIAMATASPSRLLLVIQHQLQHIVRELRELETHGLELWLGVVPEGMRSGGPEGGHRLPDRGVLGVALLVYVACVCELALRGRRCAVDFAVCEGLEVGELELVGERVDAGVNEEARTVVVGGGDAGVFFEGCVTACGRLFGEVFVGVEVFDGGAHGVYVGVGEYHAAGLLYKC